MAENKNFVSPNIKYPLPQWLKVESGCTPAVYEQVWNVVRDSSTSPYCNLRSVSQVFLTSGVPFESMSYLWSVANLKSPSQLSQQELYVMLALIALLQNGYAINDIIVLKQMSHPIVPHLDLSVLQFSNFTVKPYDFLKTMIKSKEFHEEDESLTNYNSLKALSLNFLGTIDPNGGYIQPPTVLCTGPRCMRPRNNKKPVDKIVAHRRKVRRIVNKIMYKLPVISEANFVSPLAVDLKSKVSVNNKVKNYNNALTLSCSVVSLPASSSPSRNLLNSNPILDITTDVSKISLLEPQNYNSNSGPKPSSYLGNLPSAGANILEPHSLDLPTFRSLNLDNEPISSDDEFTEFQSAVLNPSADEYTDFQSASPLVKFEYNLLKEQVVKQPSEDSNNNNPSFTVTSDDNSKSTSSTDKYDALRGLNEPHDSQQLEDDEFGDFVTAADQNVPTAEKNGVLQIRCLEACIRLLQEGVQLFASCEGNDTLEEILSDPRGFKYFFQLRIVYETSQRLLNHFGNSEIKDTIQKAWNTISVYDEFIPAEIKSEESQACAKSENSAILSHKLLAACCNLCKTEIYGMRVHFSSCSYHVPCINLFLNFVEDAEISAILNKH